MNTAPADAALLRQIADEVPPLYDSYAHDPDECDHCERAARLRALADVLEKIDPRLIPRIREIADYNERMLDRPPHSDYWHQSIYEAEKRGVAAADFFAKRRASGVDAWRTLADVLTTLTTA